jgi:prepilin-type N-terminal cleavage/methylation domain-containing protein
MQKEKQEKGFSLIELLIVVAIILIIAAIAIPNLLRARIAANESSAVGSLRTINTAEISYNSAYPTVGFSSLTNLAGTCNGTSYDERGLPDRHATRLGHQERLFVSSGGLRIKSCWELRSSSISDFAEPIRRALLLLLRRCRYPL